MPGEQRGSAPGAQDLRGSTALMDLHSSYGQRKKIPRTLPSGLDKPTQTDRRTGVGQSRSALGKVKSPSEDLSKCRFGFSGQAVRLRLHSTKGAGAGVHICISSTLGAEAKGVS